MSVTFEGSVALVAHDCSAVELGIEAARQLLLVPVEAVRARGAEGEMVRLCLGLLAGVIGHFERDLSVDEIHVVLDQCKQMAMEVLGAEPPAGDAGVDLASMAPAKGVH